MISIKNAIQKKSLWFLCVIVLLGGQICAAEELSPATAADDLLLRFIQKTFADAVSYQEPTDPKDWIMIYDGQERIVGYAVITSPYTDGIAGYSGPLPLLICVNQQEKIESVTVLQHFEAPGLIEILEKNGFFEAWNGERWNTAADKEVDTVSGATMSSQAIIDTVRKRLPMMNIPPEEI
jgi:Na+-translocating ferredoxin:NAD+ oxidoreductase RnfG subunit